MIVAFVRKLLCTIWFWTGTVIATLLAAAAVLCTVPCRELNQRQTHDRITFHIEYIMARFIYYWMTLPRIWSYKIVYEAEETKEAINKNPGAYVLASNHSSIIDTLFMAMLPFNKTYTYNSKWSKVPVFGKMCVEAGYVGIEPASKNRGKIVDKVVKRIQSGYSVMVYPEGTRSRNPTKLMDKIKTGAFRMAQGAQRPVLPLAFLGMYRGMSRYGIVDTAKMCCVVCTPIFVPSNKPLPKDKDEEDSDNKSEPPKEEIDEKQAVLDAVERFKQTLNVHLKRNRGSKNRKKPKEATDDNTADDISQEESNEPRKKHYQETGDWESEEEETW